MIHLSNTFNVGVWFLKLNIQNATSFLMFTTNSTNDISHNEFNASCQPKAGMIINFFTVWYQQWVDLSLEQHVYDASYDNLALFEALFASHLLS